MNTVVKRMEMMVVDLIQFCHGKKHTLNQLFLALLTTSFGSLLILNTEDFGISNDDAINLMVLL
jgi:hypothetical protein